MGGTQGREIEVVLSYPSEKVLSTVRISSYMTGSVYGRCCTMLRYTGLNNTESSPTDHTP